MKKINYPGIFLRVKAAVIDSIVLIIFIGFATEIFSGFENVADHVKMIVFAFIFVLYEPLMVSIVGATIGHRINNIKVQRLDNGKKINFVLAIVRFSVKLLLGWISFFTVSSSDHKQAIHDSIVSTVVVYDD